MEGKKWHEEYLQIKLAILLVGLMSALLAIVYGIAVNAASVAQENRNDITAIRATQDIQFKNINASLQRIETALGTKQDK